MATDRPHQFKIMLSSEEKAWLEEVARRRGIAAVDVIRHYIRETCEAELERLAPLAQGVLAVLLGGPKSQATLTEHLGLLRFRQDELRSLLVVVEDLVTRGYVEQEARGRRFSLTPLGRTVPLLKNRS